MNKQNKIPTKKELEILELLQENSRIKVREIAKKLKIPVTTTHSKIKRLEKGGYIKEYTTILDEKKLGLKTTAYILISFSYETRDGRILDQRKVAKKIAEIPQVQEAHIVTGDWDIIIKVRIRDVEELGRLIVDKLRRIEGVQNTLTSVVLETIRETHKLPIKNIIKQ